MWNGIRVSACAFVLAAAIASASKGQAMLPGFNSSNLGATDDGSSQAVKIGFNINFFGNTYNQLYVNNNGNVSFGYAESAYTPYGLTGPLGVPIIAPYFADVDTLVPGSGTVTYGTGTVNGNAAFGVNWPSVGYYGENNAANQSDSFQMLLISRPDLGDGDFEIEFNYNNIQWETGNASQGYLGMGGESAVVGFSNGTGNPGTFYELPGSGINGALVNGGQDSLVNGSNYGVAGSYVFNVTNGDGLPFDDGPDSIPQPAPFGSALALFAVVFVYKLRRRKSQRA
jgi:Nidogen-like